MDIDEGDPQCCPDVKRSKAYFLKGNRFGQAEKLFPFFVIKNQRRIEFGNLRIPQNFQKRHKSRI